MLVQRVAIGKSLKVTMNENIITMKQHLNMKRILNFLAFCAIMFMWPTVHGQNRAQAALLEKAYRQKSEKLLFEFFDNWSKEISSNESEAPDEWVSEAHKVFVSFYQPLHEKFGRSIYQNNPYFIVQNSLLEIRVADSIPYNLDRMGINFDFPNKIMDSNIAFRPPVHFPDKKILYLTDEYIELLNEFLGEPEIHFYEKFNKDSILAALDKDSCFIKMRFIEKAISTYPEVHGRNYVTYPHAYSLMFDSGMHRAVVDFRFCDKGGYAILEKQNDEWKIISVKYTMFID